MLNAELSCLPLRRGSGLKFVSIFNIKAEISLPLRRGSGLKSLLIFSLCAIQRVSLCVEGVD